MQFDAYFSVYSLQDADDTQLFTPYNLDSSDDFVLATSKIESCIADIRQWMTENKLKLNDDKTEVVVFSSAWHKQKVHPLTIQIGDHQVSSSDKAKNLGVIFDQHLKMDKHINSIC